MFGWYVSAWSSKTIILLLDHAIGYELELGRAANIDPSSIDRALDISLSQLKLVT